MQAKQCRLNGGRAIVNRTRVKICGITRQEDADAAVAAGADALGFVFFPKSSRYVSVDQAARIVANLPPFLNTIGLFVNSPPGEILQVVQQGFLTAVQLHGDENLAFCQNLQKERPSLTIIKAMRVASKQALRGAEPYTQHGVIKGLLLDAKVVGHYGGTGEKFDWSLLHTWHCAVPLILAGGLNPDNVAQAIRQTKPYAVDVSSGVESRPGEKDPQKMRQFIQQVQQADQGINRTTQPR